MGWTLAVVSVAAAWLLRAALEPMLGGRMPFAAYFAAVGVVSWYGGAEPALLATAASLIVVYAVPLAPGASAVPPVSPAGAALFVLGAAILIGLNASLTSARRRVETEARVARERLADLDRSRRRYEALASATGAIVWTADPSGGFVEPHPSWERFTAQRWPEYRGRGWLEAIHPDDRGAIDAAVTTASEHPAPAAAEWRMRHGPSGTWRWVAARAAPVFSGDGTVQEWVGVTIDVHEQREIEAAARETEDLLRAVADNTAACIYVKDRDGRYVFRNVEWNRLFDPAGQAPADVTDEYIFGPEIAAHLRANDRRVLEDGTPIEFEEQVPQEGGVRTFLSLKMPLRDADGAVSAVCGISTDITERKRVEVELRRLALVVEASRDFIGIADLDGRLIFLNAAGRALIGLGPEAVTTTTIFDVLAPEHHAEVLEQMRPLLLHDGRASVDTHFRHQRTRERIAVHADVFRVDDPATGEPVNFATVTRDMRQQLAEEERRRADQTRLSAALADLAAANRAKDEFLAMVSHELRNPLHAMTGWLEIARNRAGRDPALLARALGTIDRNLRRQSQVVDELLDVSRMVTGRLEVRVVPCDLAQLIDAGVESSRPAAEAKGLSIAWTPPAFPLPVMADVGRLGQVFGNLLGNAIEFTPPGGTVAVTAERAGEEWLVNVADSGEGIPPEFLPYVFDPFRQADASLTRAHQGLGLGLAIVRHLIERHGGRVEAESAGPGQGSIFRVHLPRAAGVSEAAVAARPGEAAPHAPVRVLVVEDDTDTRDVMTMLFEQIGWEVTTVDSARAALAAWRPGRFDVVLSDVGMPGQDGYELVRQLRAREAAAGVHTPAVALTGFAGSRDRDRALAAGFDAHVAKPIDPDVLIDTVRGLAEARARGCG